MIQLYSKDIEGEYHKVNWKRLKVTPNIKIEGAIEKLKKECYCYAGEVDEYDTETTLFHKLIDEHLLKELGLKE